MRNANASTFFAYTMPGIEQITWREIQGSDASATLLGFRRYRDQNGMVLFQYHDDPLDLLRLRTTEDVFYLTDHVRAVPKGRPGLSALAKLMPKSRFFDVGLQIHRRVRKKYRKGRTRFRVISRMQGRERAYRRADMQRAVEQGILARYNHRWKIVADDAELEVWIALLESEFICGIRLSDRTMRHRTYKRAHLRASLRPSVAGAMVWLSQPQPDDVFVDPMCGAGTILAERLQAGRYQQITGGDADGTAVALCQENLDPWSGTVAVREWDATSLPLRDQTVTQVVTNLPFGQQIGSHRSNRQLYPAFLEEVARITAPGGRIVVLTGAVRLMSESLAAHDTLHTHETHDLLLLGTPARIYVIAKE